MASYISTLELNVEDGKHVYPAQGVVSKCHLLSNLPWHMRFLFIFL